ncbi:7376_t:CDS:2 [Diversispora eburnea]|uniref:chitin synthase n=1 Tax=Diversispora eburnea TaxID=1213867 RepID=A0A9N9BK42_9GLOM|nr:7376_t:CDS:2 [Diversispora eburnea]
MTERDGMTPWVIFSLLVTACFCSPCLSIFGGMKNSGVRQAWREKVALCFIILCISAFTGFLTFGFSTITCTRRHLLFPDEILQTYGPQVPGMKVNIVRGKLYNTSDYFSRGLHPPVDPAIITPLYGNDISGFFPPDNKVSGCKFSPKNNGSICTQYHCHTSPASFEALQSLNLNLVVGYTWDNVTNGTNKMFVFNGKVYDITNYLKLSASDRWLGGANVTEWLTSLVGRDATKDIASTIESKDIVKCFNYFLIGQIEGSTFECIINNLVLIIMTTVFTGIMLSKFFLAAIFNWILSWKLGKISKRQRSYDKISHIILLVTCYNEGENSIRTTLDSLAKTDYSVKHKLLFVIADGNITGLGNNRPTPQIIQKLMRPYRSNEPEQPKSYFAIGDGLKQHNMAKVKIGYYEVDDHRVPMVFINKVGTQKERERSKTAGNRGKRDSQLILMKWLSHICYDDNMSPLEFELFVKVYKLTKVTPDKYELVLMVDSDTRVDPDSVSRMVSAMERDPEVMGLCGETKIANKTKNWVTKIQSFESIFGGVTCLPGCFCMYRIKVKAPKDKKFMAPILANPEIISAYSSNTMETLHQKNLLLLGEDRYLTTLMLRKFPTLKMIYVPKAICRTEVPEKFRDLLTQRRRWINSTIHNLMELILVPQLCGKSVSLPLLLIAVTYFLQIFLVAFTKFKLTYVKWMIIFIIATPIWNFVLPLYAFWRFDDISWGSGGDTDGHDNSNERNEGKFDPKVIPVKKWIEWKNLLH